MKLEAIVYTSVATRPMQVADLDRLLMEARRENAREHISGVLLYDGGQFFQYLEGPPVPLARVFERIGRASSHRDVQVLHRGAVSQRAFSDWHMACRAAPQSVLQRLAGARWDQARRGLSQGGALSEGLTLLLAHWQSPGSPELTLAP